MRRCPHGYSDLQDGMTSWGVDGLGYLDLCSLDMIEELTIQNGEES